MVLSVAANVDGSCVVSSCYDGTVRVWDAVGGVETGLVAHCVGRYGWHGVGLGRAERGLESFRYGRHVTQAVSGDKCRRVAHCATRL